MHKRAILTVAGAAAATAALIGTATIASASEPEVIGDFYAALDLVDSEGVPLASGPMEFEALDVLVGAGPELTGDDEIANPSEWCGDIDVDLDLEARTLTVTGGDEYCNFHEAYVAFELTSGATVVDASLVSDGLFDGDSYLEAYAVTDGVFEAYWYTGEDTYDMDGVTVFSIVLDGDEEPEPEPSVTPSPEPTGDVDDAGGAAPVVAEPTFTG